MNNSFIPVCPSESVEEQAAFGVNIDGLDIFVVRYDGVIYAYHNQCPHLQIPLEMIDHQFLDSEKRLIQCSTHGALFNIDNGLCIAGPCSGEALNSLTVVEQGGKVCVDIIEIDELKSSLI